MGEPGAGRLVIGGVEVPAGRRTRIDVPVPVPFSYGEMVLPVVAVRGRQPGPRLFASAAIHGDEINGVEIIRRVLATVKVRALRGCLIAVPVVNVFGFSTQSRYLPDRRDLNRSFPGSAKGSLAARLAHTFLREIVAHCSHGIDLHTGAYHRANLPQVRGFLDDPETARLARAFGVPVMVNANLRDGSLRQAVLEKGIPMLVYEGGEALRFDEVAIRAGVRGLLCVMHEIGMLARRPRAVPRGRSLIARSTTWVRAPRGGILRSRAALGKAVAKGEVLGQIADPLGENEVRVEAPVEGVVIGRSQLPLVNEGDALFHVAAFRRARSAARGVETLREELDPDRESPSGEPAIR